MCCRNSFGQNSLKRAWEAVLEEMATDGKVSLSFTSIDNVESESSPLCLALLICLSYRRFLNHHIVHFPLYSAITRLCILGVVLLFYNIVYDAIEAQLSKYKYWLLTFNWSIQNCIFNVVNVLRHSKPISSYSHRTQVRCVSHGCLCSVCRCIYNVIFRMSWFSMNK